MRRVMIIAALAALHSAPAQAGGLVSCKLNVLPRMGTIYAAAYSQSGTVVVRSKEGRRLLGLKVHLMTFSGQRIGLGRWSGRLRGRGTARVKVRFPYGLQAGRFTLVVSEVKQRRCGTPKRAVVIRLRGCRSRLPVALTGRPGGRAVDYEDHLSFDVRSLGGAFVEDLTTQLYSPQGELLGELGTDAVFGRLGLDLPLGRRLGPGVHAVVMSGRIRGMPRACGLASRETFLRFT